MKFTTFSEDRCKALLESASYSIIYENGKKYFEHQKPGESEEFYKAATTKWTLQRCYNIWYYDSNGWYPDERAALDEFKERVEKGRELKISGSPMLSKGTLVFFGIFVGVSFVISLIQILLAIIFN